MTVRTRRRSADVTDLVPPKPWATNAIRRPSSAEMRSTARSAATTLSTILGASARHATVPATGRDHDHNRTGPDPPPMNQAVSAIRAFAGEGDSRYQAGDLLALWRPRNRRDGNAVNAQLSVPGSYLAGALW
jgi:hypothetical protein